MDTIKIAFIGAGHHAKWVLYPTLSHMEGVELSCICDLDQKNLEYITQRYNVANTYTDYHTMMEAEDVHAVICCGGPLLHYEAAKFIIKTGKPLLIEKPPAPTALQAKEIAEMADAYGTAVMVAFMHRYADITPWAKKIMASPEFGNTMMINAKEGIWGTSIENVILDSGIHHLDLLRYLGGDVEWVYADTASDGNKRHCFSIIAHFINGITGTINLNSLEALSTPSDSIEIYGDKGQWIQLSNWTKAVLFRETGNAWGPPDDPIRSSLVYDHSWTAAATNRSIKIQGYIGEMEAFIDCVRKKTKPVTNLWEGYHAMQLVEAINQSGKTGRKVYINDME
jgi:myo-inositol 2-dehydrogenase/D-chiro-inositol 1-dehydrogenase